MSSEIQAKDVSSEESGEKLTKLVANHYNNLEEKGVNARKESRIYHLRNFNNWIKSVTIADNIEKVRSKKSWGSPFNVLDIGCGKGGDLLKYKKANISHITCADIAETSVKQCEDRYNDIKNNRRQQNRNYESSDSFSAEFIACDCTQTQLQAKYKDPNIVFDLVSVQFSFHYCFESLSQTKCMIKNISQNLRIGGMFIGTTPDSQEIIKRLRKQQINGRTDSFGNSIYSIKFDEQFSEEDYKIPIFGAKYDFHLEGVVDCPEFLVYFPVVEDICSKYGLKLVYRKTFGEIFEENKSQRQHIQLMNIMDALEVYPNKSGSQVADPEKDYRHAKQFYDNLPDDQKRPIGTLSESEWEATSLYIAFCFQKVSDFEENQFSNKRIKTCL